MSLKVGRKFGQKALSKPVTVLKRVTTVRINKFCAKFGNEIMRNIDSNT